MFLKRILSFFIISTLLIACGPITPTALPTQSGGSTPVAKLAGKLIAFNSNRDGHTEVYTMSVDGSNQTRLTVFKQAENLVAAWSPDGTRLAFISKQDEEAQVYVTNIDGSQQINLTKAYRTGNAQVDMDEIYDSDPSWSPDGKMIALISNDGVDLEGKGDLNIYVMNTNGANALEITKNHPKYNGNPLWSPDGKKIAFVSDRDGNLDVYLTLAPNADGSQQTNLTHSPGADQSIAWSPDGQKILFVSERDGNSEIYMMNADGSGVTNLTKRPAFDEAPAWSPDGHKIAFASSENGQSDIFVMNADGSGQVNLTNTPTYDITPHWSPGGSQIAFASNRDGNLEIYVMNADGSAQTNLTHNPAEDTEPVWQP